MYYRWGPYFETDCKNPAYLEQIKCLDLYRCVEAQGYRIEIVMGSPIRYSLILPNPEDENTPAVILSDVGMMDIERYVGEKGWSGASLSSPSMETTMSHYD